MRPHIILLGDSVFDNAAYVARGDDVLQQLRNALPDGWRATLNAQDGAVVGDVRLQLARLPQDATHLLVSAGGNDALGNAAVLARPTSSVSAAMELLSEVQAGFATRYSGMLDELWRLDLPTAICTIYDGRFPDADQRRIASTALSVLNDVITREAAARGVPMIDLRILFDDDADFANAIEPSGQGSRKIARAVVQVVEKHDFSVRRSCVFAQ